MPGRSFIGIGIMAGLVIGTVVGVTYGNLGPSLAIGAVVGGGLAWVGDILMNKKRDRGL